MAELKPISEILDSLTRTLLQACEDAAEPADKEKLAAAIKHLQQAKNEGLTGGGDDPLSRLAEEALNNQQTNGTKQT